MKKKLLLSFAVFASALAVNAQTNVPSYNGESSVVTREFEEAKFVNESPVKYSGTNNLNKRGVIKITDTSRIIQYFKADQCPNAGIVSDRGFYSKKTKIKVGNQYTSMIQSFPSATPVKLKGFNVKIKTYNTDSTALDIAITVRNPKTGNLDSTIYITKKIPYVASAGKPASSYQFVTFDQPVVSLDTFSFEISPNKSTDSIYVYTTGAYFGKTKVFGSITGDVLTIDDTYGDGSNNKFYKGLGLDLYGMLTGGLRNNGVITGKNILPGTTVVSQTGQWTYKLSKSQTTPTVKDSMFQDLAVYDNWNGLVGVFTDSTSGGKSYKKLPIWNDGKKYLDCDVMIFPIVEYEWDNTLVVDDKCIGDDKIAKVSLNKKSVDVLTNPLFNKMAFWTIYQGYTKKAGDFYSRMYNSNATTKDTLDNLFKNSSYVVNYADNSKNDTLAIQQYILGYGWAQSTVNGSILNPAFWYSADKVLVSGKMTASNTVTLVPTASVAGKAVASATGGFAPYTYVWSDLAKTAKAEINVTKGDYTATVTDANGCTSTTVAHLWVASVENLAITGLSIYPNPTANELNVTFNAKSNATIELVNVAGQVVAVKTANEFANVTFNTAELNAGVYFVNIKVAEGTFTQKVIKE